VALALLLNHPHAAELTGQACALPSRPAPLDVESRVPEVAILERNLRLAGAAYEVNHSNAESWSCGRHCSRATGIVDALFLDGTGSYWQGGNHHGFAAYDPKQHTIVLAFAGSHQFRDFVTDVRWGCQNPFQTVDLALLSGMIEKYPAARVANGFWASWRIMKEDANVIKQLNILALKHNTRDVLVLGHSKGGAMATLAGLDLKVNFNFTASVMSFEAPRCGDVEFVKAILAEELAVWRITTHKDSIVHVPPLCDHCGGFWSGKYHHPPYELYWDHRMDAYGKHPDRPKLCDASGEDKQCSRGMWYNPFSIHDHCNVMNVDLCAESEGDEVLGMALV